MAGAQKKQPLPPYTGIWIFNATRSDNLRDRAPYFQVPGGMTAAPPMGGQGEPPAGRQPSGEAETRPTGMQVRRPTGGFGVRLITEVVRPTGRLQIELTDSSVTIADDAGRTTSLPTNGKKVNEEIAPGLVLRRTARLKEGDLVIESRDEASGDRLITTYRLDPVTRRLSLLLKYESGSRGGDVVQLRRVYDRQEPPAAAAPPP
jgi:hypothetical protein